MVGALLMLALLVLTSREPYTPRASLIPAMGYSAATPPRDGWRSFGTPHVGAFAVIGGTGLLILKWGSPGVHTRRCACRPPCCLPIHFPVRHAIHHVRVSSMPGSRVSVRRFKPELIGGRSALGLPLSTVAAGLLLGIPGLILLGVTIAVSLGIGRWISRLLGGMTGDTYGAVNESRGKLPCCW